MNGLLPRPPAGISPGAVHVPGWLSLDEQAELVTACREWSRPPAGLRATKMPNAYHGVPRTLPGTGPDGIGLPAGRLNITMRESGLLADG